MISIKLKKRIFTALILFLLYLIIFNFNIFFVYALITLGTLSILEFLDITKRITKSRFKFLTINIVFIFYIFLFCIILFYFINFIETKILFFALILACISSDIGGFIFGNIFKGPKLTKISPNKTISGSLGSIIFSNIFFPTSIYLFTDSFAYSFFVVATITSIFCQFFTRPWRSLGQIRRNIFRSTDRFYFSNYFILNEENNFNIRFNWFNRSYSP